MASRRISEEAATAIVEQMLRWDWLGIRAREALAEIWPSDAQFDEGFRIGWSLGMSVGVYEAMGDHMTAEAIAVNAGRASN